MTTRHRERSSGLTRLVPRHGMATAVFVTFDPYTGELRYASTGHPPLLLIDVETGRSSPPRSGQAPPLGWSAADELPKASCGPAVRAMLALYGWARRAARGEHRRRHRPPRASAPRRLGGPGRRGYRPAADDLGPPARRPGRRRAPPRRHIAEPFRPARPTSPPTDAHVRERRRLRAWPPRRDFGEVQRTDAILAVSEGVQQRDRARLRGQGRDDQAPVRASIEPG